MKNKKQKIIFFSSLGACILYVVIAARPLSREIQFEPVWTIDSSRAAKVENPSFENVIPFKLGQNMGYFNEDGQVLTYVSFPYKAVLTPEFYTVFGTSSPTMPVYSPDGNLVFSINKYGFPFFEENRKYLLLPGGSSFSQLNDDGTVRWTFEYYSPITAFSSSEAGVVAGFADGNIIAFDEKGKITQRFTPGGSNYPVIYGAGISDSGKFVAAVSGQERQRFVLSKKTGDNTAIISHKFFDTEMNHQVLVKFRNDEKAVYYNYNGGIGIVNTKTLKYTQIPLHGLVISIKESENGIVFVLSRDGRKYTVSVIEPVDVFAGSFSFDADDAFIEVKNNSLYVGRDTKISKINIHHR
ncbi:PQQ-like beta-propeller repeat protein [Treponema zioleckii]|uniref:PQQ-like beta-propeller repeat protein n=1 Tax=Treponema zioleckii TaxID=331680 RepID=UPI00168B44E3|nr:PQQ-like beta-propeller repeat protein [Treponema zioleckii]